jgi:hypothetical protein
MFSWLEGRRERNAARNALFVAAAIAASIEEADRAAYLAAWAACQAAGDEERQALLAYLNLMTEFVRNRGPEHAESLERLSAMIRSRQIPLSTLRARLSQMDREYWRAYLARDSSFFKRRYPDLNIITLDFFVRQSDEIRSVFNSQQAKKNIAANDPDAYRQLVKLGVIDPEG